MSSPQQQYCNEKKRMEEAVAKVREVVHTASKNDIILALHNFDLDVNRTIQAFCDDGAQSALTSWERSGTSANKKKSQKKKKATTAGQLAPIASSISPRPNGHTGFSVERSSTILNGASQDPTVSVNSKTSASIIEVQPTAIKQKAPIASSQMPEASNLINFNSLDSQQKNQALLLEVSNLKNHGAEIEKIEAAFEHELSIAEENARNAFKAIRQLLADRESHLLAELKRSHDDGARILNERRVQACELLERAERIGAMNDREQAELREEMIRFAGERSAEAEIGHTTRFLYDNADLIKLVKNFGEVVGVKGFATAVANSIPPSASASGTSACLKRSTSHSSAVSSLGEDSGLGQISPVTNDDRKNIVEVSNGGILMKSDALSADQLADLNRKLQESLKAQGIDAAVLSGIGGLSSMPVRRRPAGGARGGGRGNPVRNTRAPPVRVPKLSILQS